MKQAISKTFVPGFLFIGIWLLLITIEVRVGSISFLKVLYTLSILVLVVVLFVRIRFALMSRDVSSSSMYLLNAFLALTCATVYVLAGLVLGVNFKFLIGGVI
jgi:hypothetical protein